MADAYHHAVSSAKRFGGVPEDYLPIHRLMDSSKGAWADQRHRVALHTSFGIAVVIELVGLQEQVKRYERALWWCPQWLRRLLRLPQTTPVTIRSSTGRHIPIRQIAEQHCLEDFGFVPTLEQYLQKLPKEPWMSRGVLDLKLMEKDLSD